MKNILLATFIFLGLGLFANTDTTDIKTDVQCGMCKSKIESKLNKIEGIDFVEVDVDNDVIHVIYDAELAPLDKIETLITKVGYVANDKKASKAAVKRLPGCCRPGGH